MYELPQIESLGHWGITMSEKETRVLRTDAECRVSRDNGRVTISGYAAVFNSLSEDLGGFREVIRPGTFRRAISEGQDVRALVNHDPNLLLGRTASGTLRLAEDKKGLRYEIDMPDISYARDAVVSLERRDMTGSSFAFSIAEGGDNWRNEGDQVIRELLDADLFDVSVVTYPAYPATTSEATRRSLEQLKKPERKEKPNQWARDRIAAMRAKFK
jgi:uncharacterized protein